MKRMRARRGWGFLFTLIAAGLAALEAGAAPGVRQPVLRLPPTAAAPVIDGTIGADEWAGAWMMEGSVGSADQNLEERRSWAYIGYDRDNLYLAIRSATRPGGKLYTWAHDPDEALLGTDGVEFWIAAPATPGEDPIDRYQIWFDSWGTQWALVHRYGAGFNVQEKLNRASRIHDDVWDIELAFPWRLLGLKPEDIADGRHILVRPCRNWVAPFIYTSWGGSGAFYKMDNMIRVILDSQAPLVRVPELGPLFEGKAGTVVEVTNPGKAPVAVRAGLTVGGYPGGAMRPEAGGSNVASVAREATVEPGKTTALIAAAAFAPVPALAPKDQNSQLRPTTYSVQLDVTRVSDGAVLFSRFMGVPGKRPEVWQPLPSREAKLAGGFYPGFGKVRASLELGEDPRAGTVTRATVIVFATNDPARILGTGEIRVFPFGKGEAVVEVGDLPPGGYAIRAEAFAGEAKLDFPAPLERLFTRVRLPWENTQAGISDTVYPPFTPIAVRESAVSCVLRDHELDGLGLWRQVVAKGEPILAGPMRLEGRSEGKPLEWKLAPAPRFTKKAGHETTLEGEASCAVLSAKTRCLWEYDGMMKVELDLAPAGNGRVDELELVIPVKESVATLMHSTTATRSNPSMEIPAGTGVVWDSRAMVQTIGKGSFTPFIWIGGVEKGVGWFADNDRGWITDDREPAFEIERAAGAVNLRVRLINRPGAVTNVRRIVFGLMATPVKPVPAESRAWGPFRESPRNHVTCLSSYRYAGFSNRETLDPLGGDFSIFGYFAKHQGTGKRPADASAYLRGWMLKYVPEPEKGGLLAQLEKTFNSTVSAAEAVYYTNPALEDGSTPQGRQFGAEWKGGVGGMGCNFVKSYNDYAAWCYDRMLAEGLKGGVYQDNTFPVPSRDVISGSAYVREDGRVQAGWNMFGHREFYKRLFVTGWQRMGRMPLIYPHTTNARCDPLFSFATIHLALEWEQGSSRTFQEKFRFPLLRTEVMGKQTGLIPRILCHMECDADDPTQGWLYRTREGVLLLHDCFPRGMGNYMGDIVRLLMPLGFHRESCEFVGYWDKPAGVTVPEGTEVSLFKMEKGVLAVVVDTSGKEGVRRVTFDPAALGRKVGAIRDFEADSLERLRNDPDPYISRFFKPDYTAYGAKWVYFHPDRGFKEAGPNAVEFNLRRHDYCLLLLEP